MKKEAEAKRRQEEAKRQQEETRRSIEAAAKLNLQQQDAQKRLIEEKNRQEREAIERQRHASQQQIRDMEESMRRQKDEAFRQLDQERRDRERREQLRREHDAYLARGAEQRPIRRAPVAAPRPQPNLQRRLDVGRPFEAEDRTDEAVLNAYSARPAPDISLPKVAFFKRNGTYWLGGRRCNAIVDGGQVLVKLGRDTEYFASWIEKAERVEALRLKGLHSAQTVISLQQALGSRRVPVKTVT